MTLSKNSHVLVHGLVESLSTQNGSEWLAWDTWDTWDTVEMLVCDFWAIKPTGSSTMLTLESLRLGAASFSVVGMLSSSVEKSMW